MRESRVRRATLVSDLAMGHVDPLLDFPERNDDEWLKHINLSMNGGDIPKISYSPVTMTQWEPQERTY